MPTLEHVPDTLDPMARGGRREGAGRPPVEGEKRDRQHKVWATESALDRWRLAAEIEGLSLADWTREHLDEAAEKALKKGGDQ